MSNRRIRGLAISRPVVYGNDAHLIPVEERTTDHTHRWTVALRSAASPPTSSQDSTELNQIGGQDDLSYFIKKVTFKLHDTYPSPLRTCDKPPFEVTETGWGEFEIIVKVFFVQEANEKPLTFTHHLKLHPWPLTVHKGPNNLNAGPEDAGDQSTNEKQVNGETPADGPVASTSRAPSQAPEGAQSQKESTQPSTSAAQTRPSAESTAQTIDGSAPKDDAMQIDSEAIPETQAQGETQEEATQPVEGEESTEEPAFEPILTPVRSWQYDEIVFTEPTESLYKLLVANPVTPLPDKPLRPLTDLSIPVGLGGQIGELTKETERVEGIRLEMARKQVLEQLEKMREALIKAEKELKDLGEKGDETNAT